MAGSFIRSLGRSLRGSNPSIRAHRSKRPTRAARIILRRLRPRRIVWLRAVIRSIGMQQLRHKDTALGARLLPPDQPLNLGYKTLLLIQLDPYLEPVNPRRSVRP